jgi:hypothetical protein
MPQSFSLPKCLCVLALGLFGGVAIHAAPSDVSQEILVTGAWQVAFDTQHSALECRHKASGTVLSGPVSFIANQDGKQVPWTVQLSRDGVKRRLALVDDKNDVQGYVAISADADQLALTVLHRPPQTYDGVLRFSPEVRFGSHAFACRTRLSESCNVVQMASGPADSLLNDSLFDAERDALLRFGGKSVTIATANVAKDNGGMRFDVQLSASIAQSGLSAITIECLPDYYRSRYVPHYRLIDRKRCPKPPTGWMAWNIYWDKATEDDNLNEARVGAKMLKPYGLEFWSIESWQDKSPILPVSNFNNLTLKASPEEFPHGMKWLADQIRSLGLRPGIWTVSFGTGDENFYKAHRDWFLHDKNGRPISNWNGRYILDPSQEAVRKFTEETHRTMSKDWGYEFFKTDGMSGVNPGYSAHFFERPEVRAAFREKCDDPFGLWMTALRRGIGDDRVLLACQGHYTGPEVNMCDAARVGGDIVHFPERPDWACYRHQAAATQSQLFMNNIIWYNDPDTLMVGEYAPMNIARLATTVVGLPGQLTFFGDMLTKLPAERMRLLQQTLPVCDVRPLDLGPQDHLKPIWDLKIRRPFASWDVVSVFNWGEKAAAQQVSFAALGLDASKDYLVFDFFGQKLLGTFREGCDVNLEPHSNVLLAVHPDLGRPQLLSTDRHITQGGVELLEMAWNDASAELACTFAMVERDRFSAYFHVPSAFILDKADAEDAVIDKTSTDDKSILAITLHRDTSGNGTLRLKFRKK